MTSIHGFELVREQDIPEINTKVRLFRHLRTGLELLSLENDDENKTFGVAFKTPPTDDTGLPHILEHTVLAGSRKYPTKEPFVELLKTSLKTFLNAMTFDDMTIYPVASTNLRDFYNLVDVYMDAVFYPIITPEKLKQEGWHYENATLEDADSPIIYKGVVFNEMKSVYSSPDQLMGMYAQNEILPDTPYAKSSGGDPAAIPNLTFEQFKSFHETYYHPTNARVFFYGDDDATERLRLVNDFIAEFDRREIDTELPLQPRFDAPRTSLYKYDAGETGEDENKSMVTISWLLEEVKDTETLLSLKILEHILLGSAASPLRRVLIESGLGEDIVGGGLDTYKREAVFSTGLKGIQAEDAENVEKLILQTLGELADGGIDRATVEASLNTVEFELRERNTGMWPRGLITFISILPQWLHYGEAIDSIAFEKDLNAIKAKFEEGTPYFEGLIGKYFLDNTHRSTVKLVPDPKVGPEREAAERAKLDQFSATLSDEDRKRIKEEAVALKIAQETPDRPEDLATIPVLSLDDIDPKVKTIPIDILSMSDTKVIYHDLPTAGIVYFNLGMNLRAVPTHLLPYVEIFGTALTEAGTEHEDFISLDQRIGAKTGGIDTNVMTSTTFDRTDYVAYFVVNGKSLLTQSSDMLAIIKDILHSVKLDNRERIKQIVLEEKAEKEAYLGLAGNAFVNLRVKSAFNAPSHADELMGGVSYIFFLRELAERIENDWDSVLKDLETVRDLLVNRAGMVANVTLTGSDWEIFKPELEAFLGEFPVKELSVQDWGVRETVDYEALTLPAQVNFVAKAIDLYDRGYELHGSHVAIFKHMAFDYMWTKIRVQGGAYGGTANFNNVDGIVSFLSWRDPNITNTLDVYNNAGEYLKKVQLSEMDLERAIIGAIGQTESHMLPDMQGRVSFQRYLVGITDEKRQELRDQILTTTIEDFHKLGEFMANISDIGKVAVIASPDATKKANTNGNFTVTRVL